MNSPADHFEIERRFLLSAVPELPEHARRHDIEQGYTPPVTDDDGVPRSVRVRKRRQPDGTTRFIHTIKEGRGLVRREMNRELEESEFNEWWAKTEGRRLRKQRYQVDTPIPGARTQTWEIDVYPDFDLCLAEVELDSADEAVPIPAWVDAVIVREVTDEPEYSNAAIAAHPERFKTRS